MCDPGCTRLVTPGNLTVVSLFPPPQIKYGFVGIKTGSLITDINSFFLNLIVLAKF